MVTVSVKTLVTASMVGNGVGDDVGDDVDGWRRSMHWLVGERLHLSVGELRSGRYAHWGVGDAVGRGADGDAV